MLLTERVNHQRIGNHLVSRSPGTNLLRGLRHMTAIAAAVLFGLALIFELAGISLQIITSQVLIVAGLLCVALHLAGVGTRTYAGRARR